MRLEGTIRVTTDAGNGPRGRDGGSILPCAISEKRASPVQVGTYVRLSEFGSLGRHYPVLLVRE